MDVVLGGRRGSVVRDGSRREDALEKWLIKATKVDNGAEAMARLLEQRHRAAAAPSSPRPATSLPASASARLAATKPMPNTTHENAGWLSDRSVMTESGGHLATTTLRPTDRAAMSAGMQILHKQRPKWLEYPGGRLRRLRDPVADANTLYDSLDALIAQEETVVDRLQSELVAQNQRRAYEAAQLAKFSEREMRAEKGYPGTRLSARSGPLPK